jgi:hypothetical protein
LGEIKRLSTIHLPSSFHDISALNIHRPFIIEKKHSPKTVTIAIYYWLFFIALGYGASRKLFYAERLCIKQGAPLILNS